MSHLKCAQLKETKKQLLIHECTVIEMCYLLFIIYYIYLLYV
jgi:hypothetical protein